MHWRALGLAVLLPVASTASSPPHLKATIPTGLHPCGAAAGFGSVWVAGYDTGALLRVDPRRNRVARRIKLRPGICPVAVGSGSVWVANDRLNLLYRVDPRRSRVLARIRVGRWPAHLFAERGAVWVSGYEVGTVTRIDPRRNRVARVYRVGGHPSGIARAAGSLWLGFGRDGTALGALDTRTGTLTRVPIGHRSAGFVTAIEGSIWTTTENAAVRVDASTRRLVAALPIPGTPAGITRAPDGTIWIAEKERNTLTRIDPGRNEVVDVSPAGPGALAIVVAAGDVWVTSFAGADVRRYAGAAR
jgi:streptogramin lyase